MPMQEKLSQSIESKRLTERRCYTAKNKAGRARTVAAFGTSERSTGVNNSEIRQLSMTGLAG
jgi:hypothetical protein